MSSASRLPDAPALFEAWTPTKSGHAESGEGKSTASLALDMGSATGNLRQSGGVGDALDVLQRPVVNVFPPNKIFARCGKCGKGIERFKGYKHIRVGDKKTYCWQCHQAMGLPLREVLS